MDDAIKELQVSLEESLNELNRVATKALVAQIIIIIEQCRNGGPSNVVLMWSEKHTPVNLKEFIYSKRPKPFTYAVILPTGYIDFPIELDGLSKVKLHLPQNTLLIYFKPE